MKLNKFANLLVIALVLTVAASGCRKKPVGLTPLPGMRCREREEPGPGLARSRPHSHRRNRPSSTTDESPQRGMQSNPASSHQGWTEDAQALKADTVYFDFDSSVVKASEKPKVSAVADYLKANPAAAVRVEGNCDERGTEEYNRSLGERRALAVREELISLGIDRPGWIRSATAKTSPVDPGHDEAAWKQEPPGRLHRPDAAVSKPGRRGSNLQVGRPEFIWFRAGSSTCPSSLPGGSSPLV